MSDLFLSRVSLREAARFTRQLEPLADIAWIERV